MADPLSIAAGVAGLLSLAGAIIPKGYALCNKFQGRGKHLKSLMDEVSSFSGLLSGLREHLNSSQNAPDREETDALLRKLGSAWSDTVNECRVLLQEIQQLIDRLAKEGVVRAILRGAWDDQIGELVERMERYKTFFILCFDLNASLQGSEVARLAQDMMKLLEQIKSRQEDAEKTLQARRNEKDRIKVLDWLGRATATLHQEASTCRLQGSGGWFLNKPEFSSWLSSDNSSFLWLNGIPGSGKTILISTAIDMIESTSRDESVQPSQAVALGYYYCRALNGSDISSEKILGSLVSQFLARVPESDPTWNPALELFKEHQKRATYPSFAELKSIFLDVIARLPRPTIVIDALDEILDRQRIVKFLAELPGCKGNLKLLVASRRESDLERAFGLFDSLTITPEDTATDIKRYVTDEVIRRWGDDLVDTDDIIQEFVHRADGMFLWVVCQLDHLSRVRTSINREVLKALPRGLERSYHAILSNLAPEDKTLAKKAFQMIIRSRYPLDVSELVEAIAMDTSVTSLKLLGLKKLRRPLDIFEICGNLIRTSQISGKLELSHHSVLEFLASPTTSEGQPNEFFFPGPDSTTDMAVTCIRYLNVDDFGIRNFKPTPDWMKATETLPQDENLPPTAFLEYAASNWAFHASQAPAEHIDQMWPTLAEFFDRKRGNFDYWSSIVRYIHGSYQYPEGLRSLHVAAFHGLIALARKVLDTHDCEIDATTKDGRTALHIALENDRDAMIQTLLSAQASVTIKDGAGRNPLHLAMEVANDDTLGRILNHSGVDVDATLPDGRTAISIAIENNRAGAVGPLLSKSASQSLLADGRSPLHLAAQAGNAANLRNVTKYISNMNLRDANGWTPLHYAMDQGHYKIVEILVAMQASLRVEDSNGWTPLHAAIRHDHVNCLELVLDSIPNESSPQEGGTASHTPDSTASTWAITDMGRKYGSSAPPSGPVESSLGRSVESPLALAALMNRVGCVKALVKHVESRRDSGMGTIEDSLHRLIAQASASIDTQVLHTLLAREHMEAVSPERERASIQSIRSSRIKAAFRYATLLGKKGVCEQFLTMASDEEKLSIFKHELRTASPTVVWSLLRLRLLESCGLSIEDCVDGPFRDLSSEVRGAIWQYRIDENPEFDLGDRGSRFLRQTIEAGDLGVTDLLLKRGVQISQDDLDTEPLLLHRLAGSASSLRLAIATKLLEFGQDVSAEDGDHGWTICHMAISTYDHEMVKWALRHKVRPDSCGQDGSTPMHIAMECGNIEGFKLLLETLLDEDPQRLIALVAGSHGSDDTLGQSLLMIAVHKESFQMIELVLEYETRAFKKLDDSTGENLGSRSRYTQALVAVPLDSPHCHPGNEPVKTISALIDRGADLSAENEKGETLLHRAIGARTNDITAMLLKSGADVHAKTSEGRTALNVAISARNETAIRMVLEQGAVLRIQDLQNEFSGPSEDSADDFRPEYPSIIHMLGHYLPNEDQQEVLDLIRVGEIHFAARMNDGEKITTHISEQPSIAAKRDASSKTILHLAARWWSSNMLKTLLKHEAVRSTLEMETDDGKTALCMAVDRPWGNPTKVLLNAGAKKQPVVEYAKRKQFMELVDKLERFEGS